MSRRRVQVTWINVPDESGSTSRQAAREIAQTDCTALISLSLPFLRSPFTLRLPILSLLSLPPLFFLFSLMASHSISSLFAPLSVSLFLPLLPSLSPSLSFSFLPSLPPLLSLRPSHVDSLSHSSLPSLSFSPFLLLYLSLSLFFAFRLRLFFSALLLPQQKEAGGIFRR